MNRAWFEICLNMITIWVCQSIIESSFTSLSIYNFWNPHSYEVCEASLLYFSLAPDTSETLEKLVFTSFIKRSIYITVYYSPIFN